MALSSDISERELDGGPPEGGSRIALAGDRAKAFAAARRHSILVAMLRTGLPLTSLALLGFYAFSALRVAGWGERIRQVPQPKIDPVNLVMDNPHYEGFNKDGGRYVVRAETAQQDLTQLATIKLNGISGELTQADKSRTEFAAKHGVFDNKASTLELYDGIEMASTSGLKAHLKKATLATKEGTLISEEPVEVELPTANVRANSMRLAQKTRQIVFENSVHTRLTPREKQPDQTPKPEAQTVTSRLIGGNNRGPIDIDSGELYIDDVGRVAKFTGNVSAVQGDSAITTPELIVTYTGKASPGQVKRAEGATSSGQTQEAEAAKIASLVAQGPVEMTHGPGDKATGDLLEFDAQTDVAVLTGNVVLTQAPDRRVTSDRAEIDSKSDTATLTGNVGLYQGRNELHGRRLVANNKTGKTQISAPADNGLRAGRITSRFYRSETSQAAATKKAAAGDASTAGGDGLGTFKTDPKAPIDIEADVLDVDDHAKVAVYRGSVHALQGDMSIRSADLTIRYSGNTGAANDPSRAAAASAQPGGVQTGGAQLTRIEARGKVKIVSAKNGQTATGDAADCDIKANTCTLSGDVLLTQAKNVVRGTRLMIDMTTGETRIATAGEGEAAKPPVPGAPSLSASEGKRERPSALFYPKQAKPQDATPGAATSGWQSSTQPATGGPRKSGN